MSFDVNVVHVYVTILMPETRYCKALVCMTIDRIVLFLTIGDVIAELVLDVFLSSIINCPSLVR